ncbi:MAG: hypothetical protein ACI8XB_003113 [Patiriisocius sp.]|jgi:hypothetical protein
MRRSLQNKYLVFISLMLLSFGALAQSDSLVIKNKFAPDVLRFQFAGNAGMFSLGADWIFAKDKLELDASFGFIPASRSSRTFYATTFKLMYTPNWRYNYKQFQWKPLSVGPLVSRYSGLDLSKYKKNKYYPKNYYWWSIKNRVGLALSTEAKITLNKGPIKAISIYLEASMWDVYFYSIFANGNEVYLSPRDLVIMGTGFKFHIK